MRSIGIAGFVVVGLVVSDALLHRGRTETPEERGAYLVQGIANCGNCHSPQGADGTVSGPPLSGGPALLSAAFTAYPPNLSGDVESGLGAWSEDQIVTALRDGRTPSGAVLRPPMPASYGPPVGHVPDPDPANRVPTGAYLVRIGHCMQCHTPLGADGRRDYAHRLGAGGLAMDGAFGERATPNITPDAKTGVGGWSDLDIGVALTTGITPAGVHLGSPMPWPYLAHLTQSDVDAIVAYLREIPPVSNLVHAEH